MVSRAGRPWISARLESSSCNQRRTEGDPIQGIASRIGALILAAMLSAQTEERHVVFDHIYVGMPHCADDSAWYISETDADHVLLVCAHMEDGPAEKSD